jgi:archaellum component FlaC
MNEQEDPLNITPLARNFDDLVDNIQQESSKLAQQVHRHVSEKKQISDISLDELNEKLKELRATIEKCNALNDQIDMLQQLQIFSRDFNERLKIVRDGMKK